VLYSSNIQSWCLYLSSCSVKVSPGGWLVGSVFFFVCVSFSGSCLVSSSLSEVLHFNFAYCPQVQEISSVVQQLSCFGIGFFADLVYWVLVSLPLPLSPASLSLPAFLAICLLIVWVEISSLPFSPSLVLFQQSCLFYSVLVFSSLVIVHFFGGGWEVSLPRRLFWFILGVAGGIPRDAWCSPVWSAECLPGRFATGGGSGNDGDSNGSPPVFSV
jgi:hypothetical protein